MALNAWTPRWSTREIRQHGPFPKKQDGRKIKGVGQVEPSWRRHPNPLGPGPSKCAVGHAQPQPRHVAEFVPTENTPCWLALPKEGVKVGLQSIAPRWARWCRWETSRTASLPDSNAQHTNPTTQTGPLDAIHPKEPTHEACRGHPTQGPAAGPANLGRQLRPTFPDQAQRSMPWTKFNRTWPRLSSHLTDVGEEFRSALERATSNHARAGRLGRNGPTPRSCSTIPRVQPQNAACLRSWARCRSTLGNAR